MSEHGTSPPAVGRPRNPARTLRLYIAGATPNSARAEQNLWALMTELDPAGGVLCVETIDVFLQPMRAMKDGVMVTPTLIAVTDGERSTIIGDLVDSAQLRQILVRLVAAGGAVDSRG